MIHKFSRYLMTLVALFAMTTGAWADGISCSPSYIGRVICTDGSIFVSSTEAAAEGKTAVAVIAYVNTVNKTGLALALTNQGQMNWENAKTSCADKNTSTPVTGGTWKLPSQSEWSQMIQGLGGYTAMNTVFASFGGDNLTNNYWSSTPNGDDKAVYYRSSNGGWGATSRTQNAVFVRACLEFNINLLISDDMTEATMEMPANDVTIDYEIVRDMAVSMTTSVGDGTDGYRIRLKKEGTSFVPADMTPQQMAGLIAVTDGIESKTLTNMTDYTISIYAVNDEDEPTGEAITFQSLTPGRYVAIATAVDGSIYDGETEASNIFQLYQGYEVDIPAGEYITYYKEENLYVEDEDAQLYTITDVGEETATAVELNVAAAYTPLLVKNNAAETKTILLIPTDDEADTGVTPYAGFIGTLTDTTIAASDAANDRYAFNGKQFVWVKSNIAVAANKAWLEIPKSGTPSARTLTLVFGGTTKISTADIKDYTNGVFYDLNGRKLNAVPTKKGVYILNGRKVVVK